MNNPTRAGPNGADILDLDDEAIRKAYRLGSLEPSEWQDVDPLEEGVGGAGLGTGGTGGVARVKGEEDPLGLLRGPVGGDLPADIRQDLYVLVNATRAERKPASQSFDPKLFLSTVHPNASFSDLKRGGAQLRNSLEQRSEALKILVEQEFDRFVGVKVATEAVYEEMKTGPLQPQADYSTADLKESLRLATSKADQVYTPLLENRRKAERLRSTLGVFERSKFFFNLPSTLMEAIDAGRYDTALLAYKRGRNMLDSRPGQVLGLPAPANAEEAAQHKRIFEKVWNAVEKIVGDLRAMLGERLRDTRRGLDEVEKTIEILLELDPLDDPVWIFLDTHHEHIMERLQTACDASAAQCEAASDQNITKAVDEREIALDIRACIFALDSPEAEAVIEQAAGNEHWRLVGGVVQSVGEIVLSSLPPFWKVAKGYLEGKYQKRDDLGRSNNRRHPTVCRQMTNDIITTFANALSSFFLFTADPNSPAAQTETIPTFAPAASCALTAAHFLGKILNELTEVTNDLGGLELPSESLTALKDLISNAKFKFELTLCSFWIRDAKIFFYLEEWRADPDEPSTTLYLRQIVAFHRSCSKSAFKLAGGSEDQAQDLFAALEGGSRRVKVDALPSNCVRKTQSAFLDALYAFLDGLVRVPFSPPAPLKDPNRAHAIAAAAISTDGVTPEIEDTRILLTVSNLAYLKSVLIPRMIEQFSHAFRVDMSQDTATLMDVIAQLDEMLFGDYIKRKSQTIATIINHGVLGGQIDWYTAPKPKEVHSFIFDALLSLVLVHAQVTNLVGPLQPGANPNTSLVYRALASLVEELARSAKESFGAVPRFGMGGMLQATLEIEFMHQTLSAYVTAEADATLQKIYEKISSAYERVPSADSSAELQRELEALKRTLQMSRKMTALAFLCFKKPKGEGESRTVAAGQ